MEKQTAGKVKSRRDKPASSQMDGQAPMQTGPQSMHATSIEGRDGTGMKLRHEMVAEAAYYLAEKRGFEPGKELDDWHEAESRIDQYVTGSDVAH
jgi:hypothetical protein